MDLQEEKLETQEIVSVGVLNQEPEVIEHVVPTQKVSQEGVAKVNWSKSLPGLTMADICRFQKSVVSCPYLGCKRCPGTCNLAKKSA